MSGSSDPQTDLMPWRFKPGQSGNPKGRSKVQQDIQEALEAGAAKALEVMLALLDNESGKVRFQAAKDILDRVSGVAQPRDENGEPVINDLLADLLTARRPPS